MSVFKPESPEEIVFQGKIIEVVNQPMRLGDKIKTFEFARRGPGTRVIIIRDDKILLTREFRYENNAYDVRLPGGKVYDSLDEYTSGINSSINIYEEAKNAIIREAEEEVGIKINNLDFLGKSLCGATVVWDLYYFICNNWSYADKNKLEVGEDITHDWFSAKDVFEMCMSGQISEDRSVIYILRALNRFQIGGVVAFDIVSHT